MTVQVPMFEKSGSKQSKHATNIEDRVVAGFDVKKFVGNFEVLAEAQGGVEQLRAMTLHLAIRGALTGEVRVGPSSSSTTDGLVPPFDLPQGWAWRQVQEVGEVKLGRQRAPSNHTGPNMRPYLRVANVHEARIDISHVLEMNFEPEEAERFLLLAGDVLLNEGQSYELVGRPAIYQGEVPGACFQNTLIRFRPYKQTLLSAFALIVFRAYMRTGRFRQEAQQTTNIAHLSAGRLAVIEFPLPPLPEQKRIVAKVDELMKLIDDLEAKQTKKREVQTRFRTSALDALTKADGPKDFEQAWSFFGVHLATIVRQPEDVAALRSGIHGLACAGRLSATVSSRDWGNGEDLVRSILDTRSKERRGLIRKGARAASLPPETRAVVDPAAIPTVPESWTVCGIDDILACRPNAMKAGPFGSALTKSMYVEHGYKVYGQEQVIPADATVGNYYVDAAKYESLKSCAVAPGDMLISLMGTVGKVLILPDGCEAGIINPRLLKLSLDDRVVAPYVKLYFSSPQARQVIQESARGVAMDGLNIGILRTLPIPLPPRSEQVWLVAKVEQLMKLCDDLEAQLKTKEGTASKLVEAVVRELVGA
jgi:type I restriction enzyme S subunit